jgi:uncharacterized coiled-coil protein SlyX
MSCNESTPAQVPLVERLRSVPKDWREMREVGYCAHRNVPYGFMLHEAADEIDRLRALSATQAKTIQSLTDTLALCEQRAGRLQRQVDAINCAVDGYVDGAPDAGPVAKLANEVSLIINPS